jgi:hypothetical protein
MVNRVIVICFLLMGAGCTRTPAPPSPTPRPTVVLPTDAPLPPTWTPAPSRTADPTFTPIPPTLIPPTLSATDICRGFGLTVIPESGVSYAYDGQVTFAWAGVPRGVRITLSVTLEDSKEGLRVDTESEGDNVVALPLLRLPPKSGRYDWRIWITHPVYGELCTRTGYFIRKALPIF